LNTSIEPGPSTAGQIGYGRHSEIFISSLYKRKNAPTCNFRITNRSSKPKKKPKLAGVAVYSGTGNRTPSLTMGRECVLQTTLQLVSAPRA
jgi:hypothetical protein